MNNNFINQYKTVLAVFITTLMIASGFAVATDDVEDMGSTYKDSSTHESVYKNGESDETRFTTSTFYSTSSDGFIYCSTVTGDYTGMWSSPTGAVWGTNDFIDIGQAWSWPWVYEIRRAFVFFSTSSIPDNAIIQSASLGLYGLDDHSETNFNLVIQNGQPTYPHDPLQDPDFNRNLYSGNGGQISTSSWSLTGYNTITMNSGAYSWINKQGTTKLCLRADREIAGTVPNNHQWISCYSYEKGSGFRPKLTIEYTTPPDLTVNDIWVEPATFYPGDTVELWSEIQNIGSGDCPDSFYVEMWFDGTSLGSALINGLNAGQKWYVYVSGYQWPNDCNPHTIKVEVDSTHIITETNENNNIREESFSATCIPEIELTPSNHNFGNVNVGDCSSEFPFTLENIGSGTATGTVYLTGGQSSQFIITQGSGSFSLPAGQTKTIKVKFCPTSAGGKSTTLMADGSNCNDDSASLTGTGFDNPEIELTPSSHGFGNVDVGNCSSEFPFTLENIGSGTATGTVYLTGGQSSQFIITQGSGSFSLPAGQTITILVKFCPTTANGKSTTLMADGSNCNDDSASLTGTGVPPSQAEWTIMVYLDGDNNLEKYAVDDFLEMAEAGSTSAVNIIVQFDRIYYPDPEYDDTRYDNWTTTKRYRVTQDMVPDSASALEDIGEANMGEPQTLIDFCDWAIDNYPANRYCLIFWDHGSGWRDRDDELIKGVCFDDTSDGDGLEMDELRNALSSITNNGNNPIDLIGFDACLMQMIEVGYEIREYGEYMTASEQVIPAFGWKYDDTLTVLTGTPSMSPQNLGAQFVSDYINNNGHTLSTVNLGLFDDLRADVSSLGASLQDDEFRLEIYLALSNVRKYYDPDFVDLYDFARLLQLCINDDLVDANAQAVMDEIENVVTSENHDSDHANSHGISIYASADDFDQSYLDLLFAQDSQWDEFLSWYHKGPNTPPDKPSNPFPEDGETGVSTDPTLSVDVSDPNNDILTVIFYNASNQEEIGRDTDVPSGNRAEVTWLGLSEYATYSWYAVADDGEYTNQSDTWNFTTGEDIPFLENVFIVGLIENKSSEGDYIRLSGKLIYINGSGVQFLFSGEEVIISKDYLGYVGPRFIIGFFKAAVV